MNALKDILPAGVRRWLYIGYALIVLGEGATQVGYATAGGDQPTALLVAIAVTAYVGGALGLVAASNTSSSTS